MPAMQTPFYPATPISFDGHETTFAAFIADNAFDADEAARMLGQLDREDRFTVSGGAAPEIEVVRVRRPLCPTCANRRTVSTHRRLPELTLWGLSAAESAREQAAEFAAPRVPCPTCTVQAMAEAA